MKAVILRPLAIFTVTFFVLSCFLFTADTAVRLLSAVVFSVLFVLCLVLRFIVPAFRKLSLAGAAASAAVFFLAGGALASVVCHFTFDISLSGYDGLYGEKLTLEGTVSEVVWDGGYSGMYIVDVESAGEFSDFLCILNGEGGISENSIIRCDAYFSKISSTPTFDKERYYLSKRIICEAQAENITVTNNAGFSGAYFSESVNSFLCSAFSDHLSEEESAFASALLLGNKDQLSDTVQRDFTRLGISHILAISGMHLTVICVFIGALLRPLGKRAEQLGCVLTVVFYMFITGLSPSVTRSGIMLLFVIAASLFRRQSDRFTNLGIAVFLICIFDPFSCADIGLQLSFAAVFAILLYTQKRRELTCKPEKKHFLPPFLRKITASLIEGAAMTVIIVLFMLPLEWLYFGQISVISPLTSPVFSILCTLLLWTLPLLLVFSPAPTFAAVVIAPSAALIRLICTLANDLSQLRGITISLNHPFSVYFCVAIFASVFAFCVTKKEKAAHFSCRDIRACPFIYPFLHALHSALERYSNSYNAESQ